VHYNIIEQYKLTKCTFVKLIFKFLRWYTYTRRTGSVVGIATTYGLDDPVIESRWGARFSAPVQTDPEGPPSILYNGYGIIPGGKVRPGRDTDPSPPSSAEVRNRVELYLYSP
jgi:hypothetical protein